MIEIITFHKTTNYGALLQALSLKEFIEEKMQLDVSMCKFHPRKLIYAEFFRPMVTKKITKLIQTVKKNLEVYLWYEKAFNKNLDKKKSGIKLSIFGSDEVWNFNNAYHGYDPYYFGKNNSSNKIAYAASIGRANLDDIGSDLRRDLIHNLEKFDDISVRDLNTYKFVKNLINFEPTLVLDPTLIHSPKILNNTSFIKTKIKEKYVLIYGTVFSEIQKKLIFEFCKKRNLKLISVGYYNKWIKENHLGLNPTNFIDIFKNSSFVFTSMFHGVMFSVKLAKQFYLSIDPIRKNKLESFVNIFDLKQRIFFDNLNLNEINYDELNKKMNTYIKSSQQFLINNINRLHN